ncbi:hypothetical protein HF086_006673 [Spodoptera exigua]|uniref:Cadherin domain-containing protein n=1 Tax=Spodoptera exigua TaxID=7107 RepID=A0A922SMP2_SPOEX|nr:hypothetical protein HF086_006673 [Spodoptera exigua]
MNGGAVESFFISEDTPVGSVIGTLSVNGDPAEEQGDISLRLQEKGAAVGIAAGTKNLTLLRALDREEKRGPSNVYVNVRCDRRRTTDPSFIIPVSVRVWDVNDNAPQWVGAPYRVRLSELTAPGTRVAVGARAVDADQPGPHATIHYSVLPGPNHEYLGFSNELDSVLVVKKPLDYETLSNFTVTLRAQDAGTPPLHNDTVLQGTILVTSPGPISAADQDVGINAPLQYSATGDNGRLLVVDKDTGQVTVTKQLIEELNQPLTVVIKNNLQFYVSDRSFLDKFAINSAGEVVLRRPLDYETADSYQYQVMVTDGVSNDTASINITVLNVNEWEPRFRYPQYEFRVEEDPQDDVELLPVGKLDVFDGDKRDTVTLSLRGSDADMLYVNASGDMFLRGAALRSLNSSVLHVVATAVDSGAPPRQTSVPVTVHVSERLLQAGGGAGMSSAGGAGPVMAVFACALAALALLVCALLGYIYRVRRRSKRSAGGSGTGYVTHEKPLADQITPTSQPTSATSNTHVTGTAGVTGATGTTGTLATSGSTGALRPAGSSGSLLSVSAGASTILANSTSSLDLQQEPQNVTHGAQQNSVSSTRASSRGGRARVAPAERAAHMSDHLCARAAGGRSGVAWPAATIPARVKQLSWGEDAHTHRGRADGRDQPRGGRPHEPHRLLLTGAASPTAATSHQDAGAEPRPEMNDAKLAQESCKYKKGDNAFSNDTKSEKKVLHDNKNAEGENKGNIGKMVASSNIANVNNVPLPGSTTKSYYQASPAQIDPLTAALNTVGVPVYSNPLPDSYLFTSHHDPAHYYIPGLSEPSSPSNYPTMLVPHPGHPSHAIVFENESRPPRNRPIPTHILVTASNNKRTKHLKPPSNNKLKTKPVTILTPVTFPVQSSSQSALFHPTSNYAAPIPTSHVRRPAAQTQQAEPISTISSAQYSSAPSAPMLLEEEPAALCGSLPPAYATIDPKKLRAMHVRPAVFKRGAVTHARQYQLL